jgi:ammonia channel protein AmtB
VNNTVPINSKKFLGAYSEAQNSERIPDGVFFSTGVIFSVVLPQIIFGAYGGSVSLAILAASLLVGVVLGLIMYYRYRYQVPSCVAYGDVPQAPPREDTQKKKAA